MSRKGQVTMFMIVGGIILLIAILAIAVMNLKHNDGPDIPVEGKDVYFFAKDCFERVARDSVELVAAQGGRIYLPERHFEYNNLSMAYSVYENENRLVSIEDMEKDMSDFVANEMLVCVNNFSEFKGKDIAIKNPEVRTIVSSENVNFEINFPIIITQGDSVVELNQMKYDYKTNLGKYHNYAKTIVKKQIENPEGLSLGLLGEFDAKVNFGTDSQDTLVISLADDNIVFMIAQNLVLNKKPIFDINDTYILKLLEEFELDLNCIDPEGDKLFYSDDSALTDISEDGVLYVLPELLGEYEVNVECKDEKDNRVVEKIAIKVIE